VIGATVPSRNRVSAADGAAGSVFIFGMWALDPVE
jgi:hypothetical protein